MTAGSEDVLLVARVPEADVDVDDDVPHDPQDGGRHQSRDLPEVLGQQLPHFRAAAPESRLELHSPPEYICSLILKKGVVVSRVRHVHVHE